MRLTCVMVFGVLGLTGAPWVYGQQNRDEAVGKESFQDVAARARATGQALIIFGMTEGCSRCQAVKQGIAATPEIQLLLTQYVSTEIPFGGREFGQVFRGIVEKDKSIPRSIGAPSVFIFTSRGETVYAGPNRQSGIAVDEEFKDLLIQGIEKNGGVRPPRSENEPSRAALSADLNQARKLMSANQPLAAAALVAKHLPSAAGDDEQTAALVALTGLQVAGSEADAQRDSLVQQLTERAHALIQAAVAMGATDKATLGAVKLAELQRAFGEFPGLASTWEAAWKEIEKHANIPDLRRQAEQIDRARQAESAGDASKALAAYQSVTTTYPNTQAAELSQVRITQLEASKSAQHPRLWKSKNGRFSVTASLLSFDGVTARLQSSEGKTLTVPVDALSAEDQRFLQSLATTE